jgi:aspartate/methionine/tyrosine aminotransferase
MPGADLHISDRVALLTPTAVNSILAEVRALQAQGRPVISLMRGEPDFQTPEHIVEAGIRALASGRTHYADNRGEPSLREAVAVKLSRDNELSYDPASEILITDGATLGIYAALMSVVNPGDDVLLPDPIYDAYRSAIRIAGARFIPVKSTITNRRFHLNVDDLESVCTPRTKALLLNTPWNPAGTVFRKEELAQIAEFVERRNLILVSDEIYEYITYDPHKHVSPASLSPEFRNRCILINSFSKTYAMTGWRLGYCAAPKHVTALMSLILQQSSRGPATFVQDAGVAALTGPQNCVMHMRQAYAERRQMVVDSLSNVPRVSVLPPEGGFFAMVDIRQLGVSSDNVRKDLMRVHGVVVAHGSAYGEAGEGTLRVSFATGGENLTRGLEALRTGLAAV